MFPLPVNTFLKPSDRIVVGNSLVMVGEQLASTFIEGDRLIGIAESGEILHLPQSEILLVDESVKRSRLAFDEFQLVEDEAVTSFFTSFAEKMNDELVISHILEANNADVCEAKTRNRSVTRLVLSEQMRIDMIGAIRIWENSPSTRGSVLDCVQHANWTVESVQSPLGVIGFVFEGRPNVFADATGVLRSGNTCVFRIGSDALRTAIAIMEYAIRPSLKRAGLPQYAIQLLEAKSHAAGWALFSDSRIDLAVARGSGSAVSQLGAVARQAGIPVSLHGLGGAWIIAGDRADAMAIEEAIFNSLDRKVCNTVNVVCIPQSRIADLVPAFERAITKVAAAANTTGIVHYVFDRMPVGLEHDSSLDLHELKEEGLSTEWEWESRPECSVVVVKNVQHAVALYNLYSPQFIVSVISQDRNEHDDVWRSINAPFVGNGMTRWVDGQFALLRPELGLSNWQNGRLLGRSGILSGDSVYTVRLRATMQDSSLHR